MNFLTEVESADVRDRQMSGIWDDYVIAPLDWTTSKIRNAVYFYTGDPAMAYDTKPSGLTAAQIAESERKARKREEKAVEEKKAEAVPDFSWLSEVQGTPAQTPTTVPDEQPYQPYWRVNPHENWIDPRINEWYTDPNVLVPLAIGGALTMYLLYRAARRK
jgi:hypothetical protein